MASRPTALAAPTVPTALAVLAVLGVLAVTACGGSGGGSGTSGTTGAQGVSATPTAGTSATGTSATGAPVEKETEDLDRTSFGHSIEVDNPWFPLTPGMQLVHKGASTVDGERRAHDVVFTVTDLVKVVDGVRNVVVYEVDYTEGRIDEAELAFFAQADDGTVWHFGQYPEVYEEGELVEAPTWISGQQQAKAGISMKADPRLGAPSYSQGWGPAVDWKDRGRLVKSGQRTCVPAGCYSGVLVIEEFTRAEPDAFQLKYYARGVGNVRVGWTGSKDKDREELELVKTVRLGPEALAAVRRQALALEKHAYQVSKPVYGTTPPMQLASAS